MTEPDKRIRRVRLPPSVLLEPTFFFDDDGRRPTHDDLEGRFLEEESASSKSPGEAPVDELPTLDRARPAQ